MLRKDEAYCSVTLVTFGPTTKSRADLAVFWGLYATKLGFGKSNPAVPTRHSNRLVEARDNREIRVMKDNAYC